MSKQQLCPLLNEETEVLPTAFSHESWNVVRCQKTGFVYLANPPAYSELAEDFAWEKTYEQEKQRRQQQEPIVFRLSKWGIRIKRFLFPKRNKVNSLVRRIVLSKQNTQRQPQRVLDIGCGGGNLLNNFRHCFPKAGALTQPLGIEVSKQLAAEAAKKFEKAGGRVIVSNAVDGVASLPAESVDIAIMSCFLEHECQPLDLLQQLHRAITDSGRVVIKVPNFASWNRYLRGKKWCGFRYPDHVNYFTPHTLTLLANQAGFTVVRQNLFDKFPLSDNMYAVLQKKTDSNMQAKRIAA